VHKLDVQIQLNIKGPILTKALNEDIYVTQHFLIVTIRVNGSISYGTQHQDSNATI
jgi:hypothetical protein